MISRTTDTIEELAAYLRDRDGDSPRLTALVEQVAEDHDVEDAACDECHRTDRPVEEVPMHGYTANLCEPCYVRVAA